MRTSKMSSLGTNVMLSDNCDNQSASLIKCWLWTGLVWTRPVCCVLFWNVAEPVSTRTGKLHRCWILTHAHPHTHTHKHKHTTTQTHQTTRTPHQPQPPSTTLWHNKQPHHHHHRHTPSFPFSSLFRTFVPFPDFCRLSFSPSFSFLLVAKCTKLF